MYIRKYINMCDFFQVTMETTIGNSNDSLWQYVTPTGTVFEGVRSYVANRLSSDGKSWCSYFSMFNSGT